MEGQTLHGVRVRIIDDEQEFAQTLASRLELRGMSVSVCFGGQEGLASLHEERPDVLLLDMRMPGCSGVDVLRELRQGSRIAGGKDLPVVVVSGHSSEQDHEQALELGIQGYVGKPVQFEDLLETIQRATGRSAP
jgi:Response regulator containing CheY-like receiver, AAA-type ATPase, and DNA-binding domains